MREEEGSLIQARQAVMKSNLQALLNYRPKQYSGKVTMFWSSETPSRSYEDLRLAWSNVARDGFEVHVVPGNHMSMVEPPHVTVLAEKLSICLNRASEAQSQTRKETVSA